MPGENEPKTERRISYFRHHWRGELSLPVSYFVNGLLLSISLSVTLTLVSTVLVAGMHSASPLSAAIIAIWVFSLIIALL